jgi:hypothetical protein
VVAHDAVDRELLAEGQRAVRGGDPPARRDEVWAARTEHMSRIVADILPARRADAVFRR